MRNIVIITPDQLRQDYLGCYGHQSIGTTNIDRLASESLVLDNCYCAAPLCAPSRISFATSTYVSEHNHWNYWSTISPDVPNLVATLKRRGYRTGMFGKNHLFTYSRLNEVWDELDEICLGNYDGHPKYEHSFSSFTLESDHPYNITGRLTDEGIDFMARRGDAPFLLWLNYQDPHPAFTCPAPYDSLFDPSDVALPQSYRAYDPKRQPVRNEVWRAHSEMDKCGVAELRSAIAHYMGQVRYVDDNVGKLYDWLAGAGLLDNTIILFFSDHGELLGDYGMTHKLPVFYDCLAKIPVIIRHPDRRFAGRFTGLAEEVDLAPTLLDMADAPVPPAMAGMSLAPALERGEYAKGRETVLCEAGGGAPTCRAPIDGLRLVAPHVPTSFGPGAMLRKGGYKLSVYADDLCELYNLSDDPLELDNLYDSPSHRHIRDELTTLLLKRRLGVKVRDIGGLEWNCETFPIDVRFEPLEMAEPALDIRDSE